MRVIAGKYKGATILSPKNKGIRPTSSMLREAIFNILMNLGVIEDANVVDVCCGTGALGIEALSRGAKKAVFIDGSSEHLKLAWDNISHIKAQDNAVMIRSAAENLPPAREEFDLIFLDPPYFKGVADKALNSLVNNGWLKNGAIIVVEMPLKEDLKFDPKKFAEEMTRRYGNSKIIVLRYKSS
jgi:16S rRNA (guanine966-N2)-methyltransferase